MTSNGSSLDDLRQEIDRIDEQLHALVRRRLEVAEAIGRQKGRTGGYRPAREAVVLRRLAQRHEGHMPLVSLVRLWRELIGAALQQQGRFSVAALSRDGSAAYVDLARDHYGVLAPLQALPTEHQVVHAVADGSATVGVLPVPYDGEPSPWWPLLTADERSCPRVVFRLPFAGRGNRRGEEVDALLISMAPAGESGDDRSLLAVAIPEGMSRASLKRHMTLSKLKGEVLALLDDPANPGGRWCLIEIPEFVSERDQRLSALAGVTGQVRWLGSYPVPLPTRKS